MFETTYERRDLNTYCIICIDPLPYKDLHSTTNDFDAWSYTNTREA